MKKQINQKITFIVIALFYAIANFLYWVQNTPILPYYIESLHFIDIFRETVLYYNAPFVPLIIKSLFYWFGFQYFDLIIIFVNYIFFLFGLYCIFKIAEILYSKTAGIISMLLFSLTPAVYSLSRFYGRQDYHVMIMMIVSIYCLIKTDFFLNKKWVFLYSISSSIGLLCKDSFIAYFTIPYIYIIYISLKNNLCKKTILNIIYSFFIMFILCCWHYLKPTIIFKILFEPVSEITNTNIIENIFELTFGISQELLSLPFFILFIVSLIWYLIKYKNKYKLLLFLWLFVPYVILLLMKHYKSTIFCMGIIPPIILISSIYIANINKNFIQKFLITFFVFVGLLQFVEYSYSLNIGFKQIKLNFRNKNFYYLNEEPNIINHNKKYIKSLENLLKNIANYSSSRIYLKYNCNEIKMLDFLIYMYLNGLFFYYDTLMSWMDCSNIDTIICIGEYSIQEQLNRYIKDIQDHPISKLDNIDINHYSNEFLEFANKREAFIAENFLIVKVFDWNLSPNYNTKVTVMVRKI